MCLRKIIFLSGFAEKNDAGMIKNEESFVFLNLVILDVIFTYFVIFSCIFIQAQKHESPKLNN